MGTADKNLDLELLQAKWILGGMEPEQLVELAVSAIQHGFDGIALQQLAGLSQPAARELGKLPEKAFADLGLKPIDQNQAVSILLARGEPRTSTVIFTLLQSFPEFSDRWKQHVVYWGGNSAGSYNDMAEFVHFVVEDLYEKGRLDEVRRVFRLLEEQLAQADEETRNLVGLGFFETLQNFASWRPGGNKVYEQFFGPMSRQIWAELQEIWAGKSSLMDVIRAEQKSKNPR